MNLITRITLVFAIVSLIIFIIGGDITYRVMKREIDFEQQRFLVERLDEVERYIKRRKPTQKVVRSKLIIDPVGSTVPLMEPTFSDTLVTHSTLDRLEPHLMLKTIREINGIKYHIKLYDVIVESDDIIDGVEESLLTIYLILLFSIVIVGAVSSYFILRPFRNTLSFIKSFSLTDSTKRKSLPKSSLPEFIKLNQFLEEMTEKVTSDYKLLKEFSENASHELKTPLAILQGKLDMLLGDDTLNEQQLEHLTSMMHTIRRMTKLSDSLVLLTKIDNYEFSKHDKVDLSQSLEGLLNEFSELIELKSIVLEKQVDKGVYVNSDKTLIEVLISNLIINAIRYNWEEGKIKVFLSKEKLVIENSGDDLEIEAQELFNRFKKSNQSSSSLGLGLAIVKKICDYSGFSIEYNQSSKQHVISVRFGRN